MEILTKKQIGAETRILNSMVKKHGRVNKEFQLQLKKRGYELFDLGTSSKCWTGSCQVGYKHIANDDRKFFGVGIYNRGVKARNGITVSVYRAWIKVVN
jgi:hypothetical protein